MRLCIAKVHHDLTACIVKSATCTSHDIESWNVCREREARTSLGRVCWSVTSDAGIHDRGASCVGLEFWSTCRCAWCIRLCTSMAQCMMLSSFTTLLPATPNSLFACTAPLCSASLCCKMLQCAPHERKRHDFSICTSHVCYRHRPSPFDGWLHKLQCFVYATKQESQVSGSLGSAVVILSRARAVADYEGVPAYADSVSFRLVLQAAVSGEHGCQALDGSTS